MEQSEKFGKNMILFMSVGIQTFEFIPDWIAIFTKEKVKTILTHPTFLYY